jgi:hypothetical protein
MTGLDKFLFWYTLIFAIILTGSTVARGFSPTNLILIALFLPLTIFTILQALKRYYLWRSKLPPSPAEALAKEGPAFSLRVFLTQHNPLFTLTLILFIVAILTTVIRFA